MMLVFHVEEDSWTESISFPSSLLDDKSFLCNIVGYKKQLCVTKRIDQNSISMILELWNFDSGKAFGNWMKFIPEIKYFPEWINEAREFLHWITSSNRSLWVYDM